MKITHFLSLLRSESRLLYGLLPLAAYLTVSSILFQKQDIMFSLRPSPGFGALWFMAGYACIAFFPSLHWIGKHLRLKAGYEFLFSRAISRRLLFGAKASLLLLVCSLQPLILLIYSYSAPLLRIELPYHTPEHREETKRFYLESFAGSYLEKDELDREGNRAYVVLPQGRVSVAWLDLLLMLTVTFAIQGGMFLLWRSRFGFILFVVLFVVSQLFSVRLGYGMQSQSPYEEALAWSQSHLALALFGILAAGIAVQLFSFHRFRSAEVI